jgi:hypothetical protein
MAKRKIIRHMRFLITLRNEENLIQDFCYQAHGKDMELFFGPS